MLKAYLEDNGMQEANTTSLHPAPASTPQHSVRARVQLYHIEYNYSEQNERPSLTDTDLMFFLFAEVEVCRWLWYENRIKSIDHAYGTKYPVLTKVAVQDRQPGHLRNHHKIHESPESKQIVEQWCYWCMNYHAACIVLLKFAKTLYVPA